MRLSLGCYCNTSTTERLLQTNRLCVLFAFPKKDDEISDKMGLLVASETEFAHKNIAGDG